MAVVGDTLVNGVELIALLLQSLEKATSQPTQTPQLVTEAAALANVIAKLLTSDHNIHGMYLHCTYTYTR